MSLLAPLFLVGALAIGGPLWFHLRKNASRERTVFSALMFLQPSVPLRQRRNRLENLWLLLLRCLALALIALGFARPFFRQTTLSTAPLAAKRTVVLVDLSASMRRGSLWTDAVRATDKLSSEAAAGEQMSVLGFGRTTSSLINFEQWRNTPAEKRRALVADRLGAMKPGWESTNLGSALTLAAESLSDANAQEAQGIKEIVVVSDFQSGTDLRALQGYEWPKGITVRVLAVAARPATNAGLQLLANGNADSSGALNVRLRVTNSSESKRDQFSVGWQNAADGALVGTPLQLYVPAGSSRIGTLPAADGKGATRIALHGDDEVFDNVVFVVPPTVRNITVNYLGTEKAEDPRQPLYFLLRAALNSPQEKMIINAVAPSQTLRPADFYVVSNAPSPAVFAGLQEEVSRGRNILLVPKSADDLKEFATALGSTAPTAEEMHPNNYAMLAEIDFQHPLFSVFADPRFSDFTKIHFWKYRRLGGSAIPGARVLAKFDNGDPALVEIPQGLGHWWLLTSTWAPADSQLALSSKFVPLLAAMFEADGNAADGKSAYLVGDPIPLPRGSAPTALVRPDGTTENTPSTESGTYQKTDTPGIYEIRNGAATTRVAVNLDATESHTSPLALDDLSKLGVPLTTDRQAASPVRNLVAAGQAVSEGQQQLWRWCLVAALAFLLIESAVGGWLSRRRVGAGEVTL